MMTRNTQQFNNWLTAFSLLLVFKMPRRVFIEWQETKDFNVNVKH